MLCTGLFPNADTKIQHRRSPTCPLWYDKYQLCSIWVNYAYFCMHMQLNTDMVQPTNSDGSVCESRRLEKSTDSTPLAYVVESLTRCCRILNPTQPYL